jgi:hypothetical protein
MVQNTGFQLFCTWHGIDTKTLPDPRNIANVGLADVYNFCIEQLKKMIKEAPNHAALLMDCSTVNFRRRAFKRGLQIGSFDTKNYIVAPSTYSYKNQRRYRSHHRRIWIEGKKVDGSNGQWRQHLGGAAPSQNSEVHVLRTISIS